MGAGARATQPSDRRTWPRSMRRTMEGGIAWVWKWGGERACAFASVGKLCGPKQGMCSGKGTCSPSDTTGGRVAEGQAGGKHFSKSQDEGKYSSVG